MLIVIRLLVQSPPTMLCNSTARRRSSIWRRLWQATNKHLCGCSVVFNSLDRKAHAISASSAALAACHACWWGVAVPGAKTEHMFASSDMPHRSALSMRTTPVCDAIAWTALLLPIKCLAPRCFAYLLPETTAIIIERRPRPWRITR